MDELASLQRACSDSARCGVTSAAVELLCLQLCCPHPGHILPTASVLLLSYCVSACLAISVHHRTSQRRQSHVRVLGLQRPLFVALVGAAGLYCLVRSSAWLRFGLALAVGECSLVSHA